MTDTAQPRLPSPNPPINVASYQTIMQNIANAIRTKDGIAGTMSPRAFAARIRLIPEEIYGEDDNKIFRLPNFLTWAQEEAQKLVRLDGSALYRGRSQEIFDLFKEGDWTRLWQRPITQRESPPGSGTMGALANRTYNITQMVGNKLYVISSATSQTSLLVIDTFTGRVREIVGLPSRTYNAFFVAGTRLFIGSTTSANTIVWIDTTNDVAAQVTMDASRTYSVFALLGTRLYVGGSTTIMAYINNPAGPAVPSAGTVTGLPSRTHNILHVAANKLFVASSGVVTTIVVITEAGAVSETTAVPSRVYNVWFLAGTMLYASSTTAATSIVRINTTNNGILEVTGTGATALPNRAYTVFEFQGTRVYVGSTTAGDTIVILNNGGSTSANSSSTPLTVPNRAYPVFQRVGNRLYLGSTTAANTLINIDMEWNTLSEITSLPTGNRAFDVFLLVGTDLWCLSSSTASRDIMRVNTVTNVATIPATGLPQNPATGGRTHHIPLVAHGRLYLGSTSVGTATVLSYLAVLDLATGAYIEQISVPDNRQVNILIFANDKIYILSGNPRADIIVLTPDVLPRHALPVYIKYGD